MRLVVAALLLLALPAFSQGKPSIRPPPPSAASVPPGTCSPEQARQVEGAFREAARLSRNAIKALDINPELPEFRRWFGSGPVKPVRRTLVLISEYLASRRPPQIACSSPAMCPGGRFAYTMTQTGAMGFCELFFRARADGFDTAAGIVIHEVSHAAARTRDVAYSTRGAAVLAKDDPAAAATNADNYEYFVESLRR